jgi:hypothetical protein
MYYKGMRLLVVVQFGLREKPVAQEILRYA